MAQHSLLIVVASTALMGAESVSSSFLRLNENFCACKNWKQVYQNGDVKCGKGKEFTQTTDDGSILPKYGVLKDSIKELLCTEFFGRIDSDRCLNMNVGKDEGTWCYVDSACKTLDGGSEMDDQISWKRCSKNDLKLRDYTPEELYNFAKQQDIGFGGLQKMSYPGSKAGERQILSSDDIKDEIPTWVTLGLKAFERDDVPYWFDTNEDAKLPFVIVHGSKVYKVEKGQAKDPQHPGTWVTLNCTMGC